VQGGGTWTPSDTTTYLWLDFADTDNLLIESGVVSAAYDKSGNDLDFTSSGTSRPSTNDLNGLNIAVFDGNNDGLVSSSASDWTQTHQSQMTIILVAKPTDDKLAEVFGNRAFSDVNGASIYYRGDVSSGSVSLAVKAISSGFVIGGNESNFMPLNSMNINTIFFDPQNATTTNRYIALLNLLILAHRRNLFILAHRNFLIDTSRGK